MQRAEDLDDIDELKEEEGGAINIPYEVPSNALSSVMFHNKAIDQKEMNSTNLNNTESLNVNPFKANPISKSKRNGISPLTVCIISI